jgi:hypothetical protein
MTSGHEISLGRPRSAEKQTFSPAYFRQRDGGEKIIAVYRYMYLSGIDHPTIAAAPASSNPLRSMSCMH